MIGFKKRIEKFEIISIFITILVFIFFFIMISIIVIKGISSFSTIFLSKEIRFALMMSLLTSTISTSLVMIMTLFVSYYLERINFIKTPFLAFLIELPLSLPFLVIGLALLLMFSTPFGKALRDIGFGVIFNPLGIIVAQTTVNLPYAIKLIRSELTKIDKRLEFTSSLLGSNKTYTFFSIILPQIKTSLIITFVLCWQRAIGEFGATLMLVGITEMKTETLPGAIYLNIATGDTDIALSAALLMLFICLITLLITTYYQTKIKVKTRYD